MKKYISQLVLFSLLFLFSCASQAPRRAEVLFFGTGNDKASNQATWLGVALFQSGINLTYTKDLLDMNAAYLAKFDAVVLQVKEQSLTAEQEQGLHQYVENGGGLIALNSAGNSFLQTPWYAELVRGGFTDLGEGSSSLTFVDSNAIVGSKLSAIQIDHENYTFKQPIAKLNALGSASIAGKSEVYQWSTEVGDGRFFYNALGKEDATWKNGNFLNQLRDAIWWSLGSDVQRLVTDLKIPNVSIYPDSIADFTARYDVPRMQDPLTPAEAMKLIQTPVDFELKLFAAEPDVVNPIAMSWDEKGRLWVIEAVDYPNNFEEKKGTGRDRIKICEDTDGDGVADKFTVFADKLNIATSLTFTNDGVLVAMAPNFIFLKDTDGDDVADHEEIILSGWSKGDTHAGPSNLQYGFDNKIWGVNGYAGFDGTIAGKKQSFGQGLYRFNPDGSDFEYLATTSNNTWGLGMSEDNNVFVSTANNTHSAFYGLPERFLQRKVYEQKEGMQINAVQKIDGHYEVHALTPNLRQVDVVGGFTSAAGHQLYTARDFPKSYWNRIAFVTEPTVRLVHNAIIEPEGAGFKESDGWNLLASSDEWFGPIHAEVGPDGAVWVLDWYNFIIQHNVFVPEQAPSEKILPFTDQPKGVGNAFESDLRDKKHGRVYRVLYKNAAHKEQFKLSKDQPQELIKALNSKNKFWRMHAQRLLVERKNKDVQQDLIDIINNTAVDEIGLNAPAIHALWVVKGLGLVQEQEVNAVVMKALQHPSAGVRKAAIQVLDIQGKNFAEIQKSKIFEDKNLNTRLAAFVKIAESKSVDESYDMLVAALNDPINQSDKWLSPALFAAIQNNEATFRKRNFSNTQSPYLANITDHLGEEIYKLDRRRRVQFSPDVAHKDLFIETQVQRKDNAPFNGLILGQGDAKNGYALFMDQNTLYWEVYNQGNVSRLTTKASGDNLAVRAVLSHTEGMSLYINDKLQASNKAVMPFAKPLDMYLRSGHDFDAPYALTTYKNGHEFNGTVSEITLRLKPQNAHAHHAHQAPTEVKTAAEDQKPAATILLKAVKDLMQYDKRSFTVKAGQKVTLIFENTDAMPHNLLIINPGTLEIVGKAADAMLQASSAAAKFYVPDSKEVLHSTKLVNPGESYTLTFTAPKAAGAYPYVCTFPGHWRGMNGVMHVVN